MRDLTEKQFESALSKRGISVPKYSLLGYVDIGDGVSVSVLNVPHPRTRRCSVWDPESDMPHGISYWINKTP